MALLKLVKREKLGTRASRRVRDRGLVPAIIYGHGAEALAVTIASHDIELVVQHGERLIRAELDGKEQNFFVKDVQYDYLGHSILHVDLTRVRLDERVELTIPIILRGRPVGVESEDGVLTQRLDEIPCECLVTEIPDELRVSVVHLHVNDAVRVSDLELPKGVKVLVEGDTVVATVTVLAEEEEVPAAEAEEAPEPEVIGEKAEERIPGKEEQEPE